jgi:hypothetical protein
LNAPFEIMTYPGSKHGLLRHADTGRHGYMTVKRFFDRTIGEDRSAGPDNASAAAGTDDSRGQRSR